MKILYRPVGLTEMNLLLDSNLKAFPPRLPEQPIFYPVLNKEYADQIAREWNTKDRTSGFVGFVTEFTVNSPFIDQFEEQIVGTKTHEELWIPSEYLEEMNTNIVGQIKLIDVFYGKDYIGLTPEFTIFEDKSVIDQYRIWHEIFECNSMDFYCEIREQWKYIYMNYKYWVDLDHSLIGINEESKNAVISKMKEFWNEHFSEISLFDGISKKN